jgi:predicted GNAT family N-acyltransferase
MNPGATQPSPFTVRLASWNTDAPLIRAVRHTVFIKEQNVPVDLELDGSDPEYTHFLALDQNQAPIGTARLHETEGRIGRMAVLPPSRRHGVGAALLAATLEHARHAGLTQVHLHAQSSAVPFYQAHHFTITGPEFQEANIPHFPMSLTLNKS